MIFVVYYIYRAEIADLLLKACWRLEFYLTEKGVFDASLLPRKLSSVCLARMWRNVCEP